MHKIIAHKFKNKSFVQQSTMFVPRYLQHKASHTITNTRITPFTWKRIARAYFPWNKCEAEQIKKSYN